VTGVPEESGGRGEQRHVPTTAYAAPATGSTAADPGDGVPAATSGSSSPPSGTAAADPADPPGVDPEDPPVEEVEVTDLLLIVDLRDEVVVVDEHPRYHLAACSWLGGRPVVPLPLDEARTDGFTPCAVCTPDRSLAQVERSRRGGRGAS
jgi:hypothetical protein